MFLIKGSFRVRIKDDRFIYDFDIRRNITIIQGDSATGKSTLVQSLINSDDTDNMGGRGYM